MDEREGGAAAGGGNGPSIPPDVVAIAPTALDLFVEVAHTIHGPVPVERKRAWIVGMAKAATAATLGAYASLDPETGEVVLGSGDLTIDQLDTPTQVELTRRVLRAGETVFVEPGIRGASLAGRDPNQLDRVLAMPVPARDERPHGAVVLGFPPQQELRPGGIEAVRALAAHLGVALDNLGTVQKLAELEAEQREVVHQLQEAVRPPTPTVPDTELGVHFLAADPHAPTGGDLWDWHPLPDGDLHLAVVDVLGKGVAATKDALSVIHVVRMLVLDGCPLERVVARADELLGAQNPDLVATLVVARYSPSTGVLRLAGGGHPPALLITAGGVRELYAPGIPIGWPGAGTSEVVTVTLGRGDTVLIYTDGLVESTRDIEEGLRRLAQEAAETAAYPAPHMARAIVTRVLEDRQREDDTLALVLRRRIPPVAEPEARLAPFEYRFSPQLANVTLVRHFLADWLHLLGVGGVERDDLLLVASELCANAVRAASGRPGALALRAIPIDDAVAIEVEDDGGGLDWPAVAADELPDPESEQGRGLFLVHALTDEVQVRRDAGATTVRAVKRAVLPT